MFTQNNEGKGLVKVYWADVRDHVAKIEPNFARLVDTLNPDKTFPLYLAYYPYGALKGDTESTLLPTVDGGYYRVSDPDAPKDVAKHLGYSKDYAPLAMLLDKNFELFMDLKAEKISIPWIIYSPGRIFPFNRILNRKKQRIYAPNGVLTMTSGSRSVFMLPNIGCFTNHVNLQGDFNVKLPPAKSLYEHWAIFKAILDSNVIPCDWRSCIMYFSEKWLSKLHEDKAWVPLKLYLHELAWEYSEYDRNRIYYETIFSMIQKQRNLKPNPYLADTARHLFTSALGITPAYAPVCDENALPFEILQRAFVESYGLKKYFPTIMQPTHFYFEEDKHPVYYSLQNPSTYVFSPKSRQVSSTLFEMRELANIIKVFSEELSKSSSPCADTVMRQIAHDVQFKYFHNKPDRHHTVRLSGEIATLDKRFGMINAKYKLPDAEFAGDAPFVRGCISIGSS